MFGEKGGVKLWNNNNWEKNFNVWRIQRKWALTSGV